MEVLSRDRELTILVDSESQRDIEQTVDDIKDIRANIALNVDGRNVDLPKDVSVIVTTVLESLSKALVWSFQPHQRNCGPQLRRKCLEFLDPLC